MLRKVGCRIAVFSFVLSALLVFSVPAASAQGNCASVAGTITGQFNPAGPQGKGWYGQVYLSFGEDGPIYAGTVFDKNAGKADHPARRPDGSGNFAGDELLTFTLPDTSSFRVEAHFIGVAGTTPAFYLFNETGTLVPETGTGIFAGATGHVSIHGSFVMAPSGPTAEHPFVWIAQITGSLCGPL